MPRGRGGWTKCPCDNCQRDNCGRCSPCLCKRRFGGDGKRNRKCVERYCLIAAAAKSEPKEKQPAKTKSSALATTPTPILPKENPPLEEEEKSSVALPTATIPLPPPNEKSPLEEKPSVSPPPATTSLTPKENSPLKKSDVALPKAKRIAPSRERPPVKKFEALPSAKEDPPVTKTDAALPKAKRIAPSRERPPVKKFETLPSAKRRRCGRCPACLAPDCRLCIYCKAKKKYGGDGNSKSHSSCMRRNCHVLYPRVLPNGLRARARSKRPSVSEHGPFSKRARRQERFDDDDSSSSTETSFDSQASYDVSEAKMTTRGATKAAARTDDYVDDDTSDTLEETSPSSVPLHHPVFEMAPQQSLTEYLDQKPSAVAVNTQRLMTPYGLEVADEPKPNVCSGCRGARDNELEGQPVLLCDGRGCHREYHLACCVPSLSQVPPETDHWLCQDCSPEGSTAALRQYLEAADSAKADFLSENEGASGDDYILYLLRKDTQEANVENVNRCPESELARGGMTHSLALCDSKSLARTRRGNENREPLPVTAYLGKPARIYSSVGNQYHTGRIVDYRVVSSPASMVSNMEFLVRFAAGKDDRKTAYQHWIVLEEHCLAIGSTLVWAQIPAGNWTPAILWLRTARELIPVQHLLNEAEGEIIYKHFESSEASVSNVLSPSKTKHKVFSLARNFGAPEHYSLINVRDQCVDLNEADGTVPKKFLQDPLNMLRFQVAKAEDEEQRRVCSFRAMRQKNPFGPFALSSRDSYTLPPLMPGKSVNGDRNDDSAHRGRPSLCPNVRRGLDRAKLVKMLKRRGLKPTKDAVASLSCEIVPVTSKTIAALKKL